MLPECLIFERNKQAEQTLLDTLAQIALSYTPCVVQHANHTVLLEVAPSVVLFGGYRKLFKQLSREIATAKLSVIGSIAPHPIAAWLLAQIDTRLRRRILKKTTLRHVLDQINLRKLPALSPYLDWFRSIGCQTLGDIRKLPPAGLARRTSKLVLEELDLVYGERMFLYSVYVPPETFKQCIELMDHVIQTKPLLDIISNIIANLCVWLAAKHCALLRLKIELYIDRQKTPSSANELILSFSEPMWRVEQFSGVLKERMARYVLKAPVVAVNLTTLNLVPMPVHSTQLFKMDHQDSGDLNRLMDLIAARIGVDNILRPLPIADYRPEISNTWSQHHNPKHLPYKHSVLPITSYAQPFWLLSKPLQLVVQQDRPVFNKPLRLIQGPERIETGWWDRKLIKRDYFVAQDTQAVRYWIFRERDTSSVRWFLHGFFA